MDYKHLTREDIENAFKDFQKDQPDADWPFVKKLSQEKIQDYKRVVGGFALDGLGENIYQIGGKGGIVTGDGGLALFHEAVKKQAKKHYGK